MKKSNTVLVMLVALAAFGPALAADSESACRLRGGSIVPLPADACAKEGGTMVTVTIAPAPAAGVAAPGVAAPAAAPAAVSSAPAASAPAAVLQLSAELMELGANKEQITEEIFANKRLAALKLLGRALNEAKVEHDGRYIWSYVDPPMLSECAADGEDTEEIVNHLRSVEGVEVAALFKHYDGDIRVSLRSSGRVNVQAAAARLGGGGHFRASGLTYHGPLPDAVKAVDEALAAEGL